MGCSASRSNSGSGRVVDPDPGRVVLTSSTYGSLLLIDDRPDFANPNPKSEFGSDPCDPISPDSVINTWELMEGLDDDDEVDLDQVLKSYEFVEVKGTEDKIVLYYTSLRGIRKTFEDCCYVRTIFRTFRVLVDERDISMDSSYKKELQRLLGDDKGVILPQVFVGGTHIGGVDEIKKLNEAGELSKLLRSFPVNKTGLFCGNCGDARFVPCSSCNGSRKVFKDDEKKLRRCLDCNENGLVRCPCCCL